MRVVNGIDLKKVVMLVAASSIYLSLNAQQVKKENGTINSKKYEGYSIVIKDARSRVEDFWLVHLEEYSNVRRKRDFYQIVELKLPDSYFPEAVFYTRIIEKDSLGKIWVALDSETLLGGEEGEELVNEALEQFMGSLPVEYEKNNIEKRIIDAKRVIMITENEQQTLMQSAKNLSRQLEEATTEKERLNITLENLDLEILAVKQRIENNKSDSIRSVSDLEKIRILVAQYEEDLKKLN